MAADILVQRLAHREGPIDLGRRCGISPRTVSWILARAGMPKLWEPDPVTGQRIRSGRAIEHRYERATPGELVHIDVKNSDVSLMVRGRGIGFDYVHVAV
ncbi:hypothetical protein [Arthrobacter sp. 260]|uniref:hypothetical protein n=1 Tax=Arthrobacter sp. 260 TaxID=2735314 RepID=UPI001490A050|nr:hypothetical protein [Arthrobacter sp. 260]NOJ61658.1 hypothetical protein [Arthrobacter sp. 260]